MIEVNNVSMRFRMANDRVNSLKEYFVTLMERRLKFEEFQVLDRIRAISCQCLNLEQALTENSQEKRIYF